MAQKRKTLPKDFEELLQKGDIAELKAVFDSCEIDARGGYGKQTALAFDECPHELAEWLVEQGADLHATDTWNNTPLHNRASSHSGNIISLIELGANVNDKSSSTGTPLHSAANAHNVENTRILIKHGASVHEVNERGLTPLEYALMTCSNIDIVDMVQIGRLHFVAGAKITPQMREFAAEIGKRFEFHRENFSKDHVDEYSRALKQLYVMFGIEAVAPRVTHDGSSTITVKEKTWQKQHQELWQLLVPSSGPAQTMQGEVIRITGRISNELDGNGGINWDADFKKMADTFLRFVQEGTPLPAADLEEVGTLVVQIKGKAGNSARLAELGVKWVLQNPGPIPRPEVEYSR